MSLKRAPREAPSLADVRKMGYLRKLKTMKKKFFVLHDESAAGPCRLEYYDSEKKFRGGVAPKRAIAVKTCFNINKRADTKQKHAIALFTKDDCFTLVCDDEHEQEEWLAALLVLQQGARPEGSGSDDEKPRPTFAHIWQVTIKNRGLGSSKSITGAHRLCLTADSVNLVRMNAPPTTEMLTFQLLSIRRCGHSDCFFFMELGRSSATGAGELWMQTEDTIIAQNMHEAILGAMRSLHHEENEVRTRSTSVGERTNKPIGGVHHRRTTASAAPPTAAAAAAAAAAAGGDALPPPRSRTRSEGDRVIAGSPSAMRYKFGAAGQAYLRPHSMYQRSTSSPQSHSPPVASPLNPAVAAGDSDSSASLEDLGSSPSPSSEQYLGVVKPYGGLLADSPVHVPLPSTDETPEDYLAMTPGGGGSGGVHDKVASDHEETGYMEMNPAERHGGERGGVVVAATSPPRAAAVTTDEYLNMSPTGGAAPAMMKQDEDKQSSYMTMSPSDGGGSGKYMQMAPGERRVGVDAGYLSMVPGGAPERQEGATMAAPYLEMTPVGCVLSPVREKSETSIGGGGGGAGGGYLDMKPGAATKPTTKSTATTSPTTTTTSSSGYLDMKPGTGGAAPPPPPVKGEYHLEKVHSYLTAVADVEQRTRTYSLGDRAAALRKHIMTTTADAEGDRGRAYSIGSRPPPATVAAVSRFLDVSVAADERKSASAPQIADDDAAARGGGGGRAPKIHSYKSEDLVEWEIDPDSASQTSQESLTKPLLGSPDLGGRGRRDSFGMRDDPTAQQPRSRKNSAAAEARAVVAAGNHARQGSRGGDAAAAGGSVARSRANSHGSDHHRSRTNSYGSEQAAARAAKADSERALKSLKVTGRLKVDVHKASASLDYMNMVAPSAGAAAAASEPHSAGEYVNIEFPEARLTRLPTATDDAKRPAATVESHDYVNIATVTAAPPSDEVKPSVVVKSRADDRATSMQSPLETEVRIGTSTADGAYATMSYERRSPTADVAAATALHAKDAAPLVVKRPPVTAANSLPPKSPTPYSAKCAEQPPLSPVSTVANSLATTSSAAKLTTTTRTTLKPLPDPFNLGTEPDVLAEADPAEATAATTAEPVKRPVVAAAMTTLAPLKPLSIDTSMKSIPEQAGSGEAASPSPAAMTMKEGRPAVFDVKLLGSCKSPPYCHLSPGRKTSAPALSPTAAATATAPPGGPRVQRSISHSPTRPPSSCGGGGKTELVRGVSLPVGVAAASPKSPRALPLPAGRKSWVECSPYENLSIGKVSPRAAAGADKELNYASLDLGPCDDSPRRGGGGSGADAPADPRSRNSSASDSGSAGGGGGELMQYTEIDFTKSEGLRQVANATREPRDTRFH